MSKPNIDVVVSGAKQAECTYKNVVLKGNHSFASQVTEPNCIYVIKWDFDLGGETVTIPENCILKFEGGSLNNGTIVGNNTVIIAPITKIFDDVKFDGRWIVNEVYPEWFGAVADSTVNDSTTAIQNAIEFSSITKGGVVRLLEGYYDFSTIEIEYKTQLIGSGKGVTILRQLSNTTSHGIVVGDQCTCLKLEGFTLSGSESHTEEGNGIYVIEKVVADTSEHREIAWNKAEIYFRVGYVRLLINDIVVHQFYDGFHAGTGNFGVFVQNSFFEDNTHDGMYFMTTDSSVLNCYVNNNGYNGLVVRSNNKICGIKSIFNGIRAMSELDDQSDRDEVAAIFISGNRNSISNCETQDNYCSAYRIKGDQNQLVNCISNSDGYIESRPNMGYHTGYNIYGFTIEGRYTKFSNCIVTEYNYATYGSMLVYPFNIKTLDVEKKANLYEMFDNISVVARNGNALFRKIGYYPSNCPMTSGIRVSTIETDENSIPYFKVNANPCVEIIAPNALNVLVVGKIPSDVSGNKALLTLKDSNDTFNVYNIIASYRSSGTSHVDEHCLIGIAKPTSSGLQTATNDTGGVTPWVKRDKVFSICLTFYGDAMLIRCYYQTEGQVAEGQNDADEFKYVEAYMPFKEDVSSMRTLVPTLNSDIWYNKVLVTNDYIPTNYIMPGADIDKFYGNSIVYASADNVNVLPRTKGATTLRPTLTSADYGFEYFDTNLGKSILWVDGEWREQDGAVAGVAKSGITTNRPVGSDIYIGFMYMDTTLGKPIYAKAISEDTVTWVDATGATV